MASTKRKFNFLKLKGKWWAKSPVIKKIVAMAAMITALKRPAQAWPQAQHHCRGGKETGKQRWERQEMKEQEEHIQQERAKEEWYTEESAPKDNKKKEDRLESTLTIGANAILRGRSSSLWIENLARSTQTIRKRAATKPIQLSLPLRPPRLPSTLVTLPSWPLLLTWIRRNDGSCQHAFTTLC